MPKSFLLVKPSPYFAPISLPNSLALPITDSKNAEIYLSCAETFLTLSKFRTIEGLKNDDSGQYLNIKEMSKTDREKLKNALLPMKDLEELIKNKFQLTQFS